jgi:hypothetical protein
VRPAPSPLPKGGQYVSPPQKSLTTGIVTGRYAEPATPPSPPDAQAVEHTRPFRRSLTVRAVDTGSCSACEMELTAWMNPVYDAERFGIHIAASPRHADALVVTGPVTVASKNRACSTRGPSTQPTGLIAPVGLMHQAAWARTMVFNWGMPSLCPNGRELATITLGSHATPASAICSPDCC